MQNSEPLTLTEAAASAGRARSALAKRLADIICLPSSVIMRESIAEGLPLVDADAGQLHQVIVNLATNATQGSLRPSSDAT